MGLGSIHSIYQARFMRYLEDRAILETKGRKVWCFVGDAKWRAESIAGCRWRRARSGQPHFRGELQPAALGRPGAAAANGSIVQELEGLFAGAGWNVIKVMWGSDWDPLFARDRDHVILKRLHETVDGEFQKYAATTAASTARPSSAIPGLQQLVAHMSDEDIDRLSAAATTLSNLRGVSRRGEPQGPSHRDPRPDQEGLRHGHGAGQAWPRTRRRSSRTIRCSLQGQVRLPLSDSDVHDLRFYKPAADSPEMKYMHARAKRSVVTFRRAREGPVLQVPALDGFRPPAGRHGDREQSTTMCS